MIATLFGAIVAALIGSAIQWPLSSFVGNGSIVLMVYLLGILPSRHLVWVSFLGEEEKAPSIPFGRLIVIVVTIMWPIIMIVWYWDFCFNMFQIPGLKTKLRYFGIVLATLSLRPEEMEGAEMAEEEAREMEDDYF